MTARRQSTAGDTPRSSCSSFLSWRTVHRAFDALARSASSLFQQSTVAQRCERPSGEGVPRSTITKTATAIRFALSSSESWSCFVSTQLATVMRSGMTSQIACARWSVGRPSFQQRNLCARTVFENCQSFRRDDQPCANTKPKPRSRSVLTQCRQ